VPFVYIVRCADGTLYTGAAKDLDARIDAHNDARGARYTRGRGPVALVYVEECEDVGAALRREHVIKRLTRAKKEELIGSANPTSRRRSPRPRE
jgi:predicted GIY-YIG superfamily endonuclease